MVVTEKNFNFNTFDMPLNFLLNIYNRKISLKEEEINGVLTHAKSLLEGRNKIIDAFKDDIFASEYLKNSDDAGYNYVLKDVNKFIEDIKSMEEKINLSLFEDFFRFS